MVQDEASLVLRLVGRWMNQDGWLEIRDGVKYLHISRRNHWEVEFRLTRIYAHEQIP